MATLVRGSEGRVGNGRGFPQGNVTGQELGKPLTDVELKQRLLELAKSGAPRPSRNSVLGRALARFTTKP